MKKFICLIIILWIPPAKAHVPIVKDSLLDRHFSKTEVAQMHNIRKFFNTYIMENCENAETLELCYQEFFSRMLAAFKGKGAFKVGIPFDEQQILYTSLDQHFQKEIWVDTKPKVYAPSVDSVVAYTTIDLRAPNSRYIDFLKEIAQEENYIKMYLKPILAVGHLPFQLTQSMVNNPSGLDFNDEYHQLILAIHFLTINDQIESRPK